MNWGGHANTLLHWAPDDVGQHSFTACGRNIDRQCDKHWAEQYPCQFGLAWTRSTDLDMYLGQSLWPSRACSTCAHEAKNRADNGYSVKLESDSE